MADLSDPSVADYCTFWEREQRVYRLCCKMSAHISVVYLLFGIPYRFNQLFSGDWTGTQGIDLVYAEATDPADPPDFAPAAVLWIGRCVICGSSSGYTGSCHRPVFYGTRNETVGQAHSEEMLIGGFVVFIADVNLTIILCSIRNDN